MLGTTGFRCTPRFTYEGNANGEGTGKLTAGYGAKTFALMGRAFAEDNLSLLNQQNPPLTSELRLLEITPQAPNK
jgi:hypothetical protein